MPLLWHHHAEVLPQRVSTDPPLHRSGLQVSGVALPSRWNPTMTDQNRPVCRYYIRTASLKLPISGCSFECYRELEVKSCCPGFWGPDCVGEFQHQRIDLELGEGEGRPGPPLMSVGSRMPGPGLPSSPGSVSAGQKRAGGRVVDHPARGHVVVSDRA